MEAMVQAAGTELRGVIASAAAGDEVAFARIVAAYHEEMRRVCVFVARERCAWQSARGGHLGLDLLR